MKKFACLLVAVLTAACGSSTSTTPTPSGPSAPSGFVVSSQAVSINANTIVFSWAGTGPFKMQVGTVAGASDLLNADVTGTTYTWAGIRTTAIVYARVVAVSGSATAASTELPVFTLDMRSMIDALFYGVGALSEIPNVNPTSANDALQAPIWADGSTINVLVTAESGDVALANAQRFTSDYLTAAGNPFSANVSVTSPNYKGVALGSLPANTIVVHVDQVCTGTGVIACANFGPSSGAAFVNMNSVGSAVSISHEIGHAFGLSHMVMNSSGRPEFRFLMNPALVSQQMTDVEKAVISAARAGGLRRGTTRSQAIALGLVLPYTGASTLPPSIIASLKDIIKDR